MLLNKAQRLATELRAAMLPLCVRCQIAGSVRRERAECKDLELVVIPKWEMVPNPADLFGDEIPTNLLHEWANSAACPVRWIKPGVKDGAIIPWRILPDARMWKGVLEFEGETTKLDLFITEESRFGATFIIRTGSSNFSHALAIHAPRVGYRFDQGALWGGNVFGPENTPEEEDVFRLLNLEFVLPSQRIDARSLRRLVVAR